MSSTGRLLPLVLALSIAPPAAGQVLAQCPANVVEEMTVTTVRPSRMSVERIDIRLTSPLIPTIPRANESIAPESITLRRQPANTIVPGTPVRRATVLEQNAYRRIVIDVDPVVTVSAADTDLEVSITPQRLECGSSAIVARSNIVDSAPELEAKVRLTEEKLADATAYATPIDQKNFYAAFAAAKGDKASGAGAADILIDYTVFKAGREVGALFDNAAIKFMLKKSSGDNADPQSQFTGVEFTKALLWGLANRARTQGTLAGADHESLVNDRGAIVRGVVIHEFLKLEGDAFDFNAVNFVSDTMFSVPSIAMKLRGDGFWNFRLVGGAELGRSQRQPEPGAVAKVESTAISDYVARSKLGGDLTLRWGRATSDPTRFAVEVDLGHVTRLLHHAESAVEDVVQDGKTVQRRVTIEKGERHWSQINARVFLFGTDTARYGVQAGYFRGTLPPLFARANGFQFGMVIEQGPTRTTPSQ